MSSTTAESTLDLLDNASLSYFIPLETEFSVQDALNEVFMDAANVKLFSESVTIKNGELVVSQKNADDFWNKFKPVFDKILADKIKQFGLDPNTIMKIK